MKLFWHEIRQNFGSLLSWSIALAVSAALFILMYPAYMQDADTVRELLSGFPPAFVRAFSLDIEIFFSLYGFFSYAMTFLIIAGAVYAMSLGLSLLAKETTDKTAEFLLTKPVSRFRIMIEKLGAALVMLLLLNAMVVGTVLVTARYVDGGGADIWVMLILTLSMGLVQLIFFSWGFFLSALLNRVKSTMSLALPAVFSFYAVGMLDGVVEAEKVKYLSPLKFFSPRFMIENKSFELPMLFLAIYLSSLAIAGAFMIYPKKDISSGA